MSLHLAAENGYLFEGDMVMSKEQIKENLKGGPSENAYGLQNSKYRKWPGGVVPYTLDSSISKSILYIGSLNNNDKKSNNCKKSTLTVSYILLYQKYNFVF